MKVVKAIFESPNMPARRPVLNDNLESNVPGLYVAGDLAGAPVVKLAMEQGYRAARHVLSRPDGGSGETGYDVVVIGAGAAGLNAALELHAAGKRVLIVEKGRVGAGIEELPEGKWIYGEPAGHPAPGRLWFEECDKDELARRWREQVRAAGLDVREDEEVRGIARRNGSFSVSTSLGTYSARRVLLASGKAGTVRRLGVTGEDGPKVEHRLYSPRGYSGEQIVVVGGGNSAAEAALALAEQNAVTLIYRGRELFRLTGTNRRRIEEAVARGALRLMLGAEVQSFGGHGCEVAQNGQSRRVAFDHAFVLVGAEPPAEFLRAAGLKLENEWNVKRLALLVAMFVIAYTIYGVKQAPGHEFWPFRGWGAQAFAFFDRPWSFWYTVLYTAVMTVFGLQALKRWGLARRDRFQIWRYVSLLGFQWVFFFLIPEFLFQWAVKYQWVGERLAGDPSFAQNAWRSYGLVYAWPLFFYTFFGAPHQVWVVWGVLLSFVLVPLLVLWHGKRYCSWICGCGGLAETLGDRWRHLAPKGEASIRWERMNAWVLAAAVLVTVFIIGKDALTILRRPGEAGLEVYHLLADVWLVGIIPITLYPFFGGKIWCRYWCPLAKMMELFSAVFTRFGVSRFGIASNEKCIACGECSRHCQVGIDVMRFALKQEEITNLNSSCIGCGICVTVCPMNVLSFARPAARSDLVQIQAAAGARR